MIQLRAYLPTDYPMLVEWWAGHGWPGVPSAILPKVGFVAEDVQVGSVEPLVAAWLYMDNSVGVCWLEWMVSNPKAEPVRVYRGIKGVTEFAEEAAKTHGYGVMLTTCRQQSLVRTFERSGFTKTDEGVTHLIKIIGGQ
jgi:hypothetical protein